MEYVVYGDLIMISGKSMFYLHMGVYRDVWGFWVLILGFGLEVCGVGLWRANPSLAFTVKF